MLQEGDPGRAARGLRCKALDCAGSPHPDSQPEGQDWVVCTIFIWKRQKPHSRGLCSAAVSLAKRPCVFTARLSLVPCSGLRLLPSCEGPEGMQKSGSWQGRNYSRKCVLGHELFPPTKCLTTSGSLHATRAPAGTPPRAHLGQEPTGGDGTSPDHNGRDDAIAHNPVTLNAVRDPGGPQGRPDHLWQEERQAHIEQLGHGFPRSRVTDGPWNTEHVHAPGWPPGDGAAPFGRNTAAAAQVCRLLPTSGVSTCNREPLLASESERQSEGWEA